MSLDVGTEAVLAERGMSEGDLVRALLPYDTTHRQRVARGFALTPRLSYFMALCTALGVDPTTLLVAAGLWPDGHAEPPPPDRHQCRVQGANGQHRSRMRSERPERP